MWRCMRRWVQRPEKTKTALAYFFSCDTMRPVSARCSRQVCLCRYVGGSPVLWDRGGPGHPDVTSTYNKIKLRTLNCGGHSWHVSTDSRRCRRKKGSHILTLSISIPCGLRQNGMPGAESPFRQLSLRSRSIVYRLVWQG
jgi:hypothetical protein